MSMKSQEYVLSQDLRVLNYLKSRYPLYHQSNVFFRDIQYGIQAFLIEQGRRVKYSEAEKIARAFVAQLERKRLLVRIDAQTWVLNNPDFRKPLVKPAGVAKPAAARPAVQSTPGAPGTASPATPMPVAADPPATA